MYGLEAVFDCHIDINSQVFSFTRAFNPLLLLRCMDLWFYSFTLKKISCLTKAYVYIIFDTLHNCVYMYYNE